MTEATINTLMQRLHRVEQDNRRWRWVAVSAMALAVIGPVVLMAQATRSKVANVVEAESFVVRDSTGNIGAILGPVDEDRMGLALYDRAGNMRSKLVVKSDGMAGLFLNDQSGDARAKLMVLPDGGPTFALFDEALLMRDDMHVLPPSKVVALQPGIYESFPRKPSVPHQRKRPIEKL